MLVELVIISFIYALIAEVFLTAKPRRKPMTFDRAEQFKFTLNYYGVRERQGKVIHAY